MNEKKIPNFFIDLFTKIFGEKANLMMSLIMFSQSEPGKRLMEDIGGALETPEGRELLRELSNLLKGEASARS